MQHTWAGSFALGNVPKGRFESFSHCSKFTGSIHYLLFSSVKNCRTWGKTKTSLRVIQLYILLQGNVTGSQRILKGQCARQLSSDLVPTCAPWQDFRPGTVCSTVDKHQTDIYTPPAKPTVISKHTWTYPSCLPLSVSSCWRHVK